MALTKKSWSKKSFPKPTNNKTGLFITSALVRSFGPFFAAAPPLKRVSHALLNTSAEKRLWGPSGPKVFFRSTIGQVRGLQRALIWVLAPKDPYDGSREMFRRMCLTPGA